MPVVDRGGAGGANLSRTAVDDLREATSLVADGLSRAGYPERIEMTHELIAANESPIALECLCSNLHEFDVPVPRRAYHLLQSSGAALGVDAEYWRMLEPLVEG